MLNSAYEWTTGRGRHRDRDRKIRLYIAGACRQYWTELPWISRVTTELGELMADGEFDESRLARPLEYIAEGMELCAQQSEYHEPPVFPAWGVAHYERYLIEAGYAKPPEANHGVATGDRLVQLTQLAYLLYWSGRPRFSYVRTEFHSVPIIHDIFGNPFSPVVFKPTWGTTTAVGLATGMYESRTFTAMPILADALEDAGCDHPDILSHCREPGPHVRGCWVVDLVLGKA